MDKTINMMPDAKKAMVMQDANYSAMMADAKKTMTDCCNCCKGKKDLSTPKK